MGFSSWCSLLPEIHLQSYPPHLQRVIDIKHLPNIAACLTGGTLKDQTLLLNEMQNQSFSLWQKVKIMSLLYHFTLNLFVKKNQL